MNNQSSYSDTRQWDSDNNRVLYAAVALALPIGIIGFRYLMRGGPFLFIMVFALIIFILYQILDGIIPPSITKTFYVSQENAEQVVENVLVQKKFPYEWRNGRFQLNDLSIQVKSKRQNNLTADGCFIRITPNTLENEPLIISLCNKIDAAFSSKGL